MMVQPEKTSDLSIIVIENYYLKDEFNIWMHIAHETAIMNNGFNALVPRNEHPLRKR